MVSDPDQTSLRYHVVIPGASLSRAVLALPRDQPLAIAYHLSGKQGYWGLLRTAAGRCVYSLHPRDSCAWHSSQRSSL
jgi:hypothetical protein